MKILISLCVALVVGFGLFYYVTVYNSDAQLDSNVQDQFASEVTTEPAPSIPSTIPLQTKDFANDTYHFSFNYRIAPLGYSVFETAPEQNKQEKGKLYGIVLFLSDEYQAIEKATAAGSPTDGSSAITVSVIDGRGVTDINSWLVTNSLITNCEEGTVLATVVDGKDASGCAWDGLYTSHTIALLNGGYIYLFTGNMDEGENANGYSPKKDFEAVIASFKITL